MFRKISMALALVMVSALALTGCADAKRVRNIIGENLVYEKDGFPDEFGLRIDSDGTFSYYEGLFSSYVGYGIWELNGDTLTLRETVDSSNPTSEVKRVNRFNVSDNKLIFLADGSDNFMYIKVSDGECFLPKK